MLTKPRPSSADPTNIHQARPACLAPLPQWGCTSHRSLTRGAREPVGIVRQASKGGSSGALTTTRILFRKRMQRSPQLMGFRQRALRGKSGQRKGTRTQGEKLPRCKVRGKGTLQEGQKDVPPSESGYWRCGETINTDRFVGPVDSCEQLGLPCSCPPPNHLLVFSKSGLC